MPSRHSINRLFVFIDYANKSRIWAALSKEALLVAVMFKIKGSLDLAPLFFVSIVLSC